MLWSFNVRLFTRKAKLLWIKRIFVRRTEQRNPGLAKNSRFIYFRGRIDDKVVFEWLNVSKPRTLFSVANKLLSEPDSESSEENTVPYQQFTLLRFNCLLIFKINKCWKCPQKPRSRQCRALSSWRPPEPSLSPTRATSRSVSCSKTKRPKNTIYISLGFHRADVQDLGESSLGLHKGRPRFRRSL